MDHERHIKRGAFLIGMLCLAHPAIAQDEGRLTTTFSFAQGLTLEDGDVFGQTDLGFAISDTTRRESFSFDVKTELLERFNNGASVGIGDVSATLTYGIESRQSQLSTDVTYSTADADALVTDENGLPGTLVFDTGERENLNAKLAYVFGREAKFGGTVALGYADTNYSGTQSATLVDRTTMDGSVDLRAEVTPKITATFGYSLSETTRVRGQNVRSQRVRVGANFEITPTLSAVATIGRSDLEKTLDDVTTDEHGLNYNLAFTQDRPNGDLSFSIASDISEAGRRTTARVGSSFEMSRRVISGSIGLTDGTVYEIRPLFQINYEEELPRGSYTISFEQAFSVNSLSEETLNSNLRLGLQQALSDRENLQANVAWQRTDIIKGQGDSSRLDLNLNYNRALSDDWAFLARARSSWIEAPDSTKNQESELFIGLQATLGWRP